MEKKAKGKRAKREDASRMPTGEVVKLAATASYATASIVSRELIENKAGSVTVFAFDAGQGLSEHTAPFNALVQVLDGEGQVTVGGRRHRVRTGEALLMPANVPHAVKAKKRFKMLLTMLWAKKG